MANASKAPPRARLSEARPACTPSQAVTPPSPNTPQQLGNPGGRTGAAAHPPSPRCRMPRGNRRGTCFEPAVGREGICCFSGSVPVLAEDGGSLHEQLPFLAFETRCHLGQARSECIPGSGSEQSSPRPHRLRCPSPSTTACQAAWWGTRRTHAACPPTLYQPLYLPTCRTSLLRWKGSLKCL